MAVTASRQLEMLAWDPPSEADDPVSDAGVVYTKPWVVELMLDLCGYVPQKPLFRMLAIEPSAGDGAFLLGMVRRLVASVRLHGADLASSESALRAFEINAKSAELATLSVRSELESLGVKPKLAEQLSRTWIKTEDYLDAARRGPDVDFVIGNPPYIRLEEIPARKAQLYREAYDTMRGRADIYIAFYQAALSQLKPGAVCTYICADRWLRNDYGRELRSLVTSGFCVRFIVETHDVDAFAEDVSAYPAITVITKDEQSDVIVAKALPGIESAPTEHVVSNIRSAQSNSVVQAARFEKWFDKGDPWPCSSPSALLTLKSIEEKFPLLGSKETATTVGIGVATGADNVFITKSPANIEPNRLLPLAMGADLKSGSVEWSGHYLVNPWDASGLVDLKNYPKLATYYSSFQGKLATRHVGKKNPKDWYRTIDRVNMGLVSQPKLYIADIRNQLSPALDKGATYPHHNLYWITSSEWDLRALGALLISEIGEFFIRSYGVRMRGGFYRFQAQYLRRIRIPQFRNVPTSVVRDLIRSWDRQDRPMATDLTLKLYGIKTLQKSD